ncbi:hypothetical protein CEXT_420171 [Caerostris extrusa]|uniref:Uncharacterized protein n=1 Tax=Caerostris extrusa TaxID=172846 RepID=A0AAV4TRM0_CAEEX|nr:hypothetical protein CEXT_420171 [Caerostris extrusa]
MPSSHGISSRADVLDHDLQSGVAHSDMSTSRGLSLTPNDTALAPCALMKDTTLNKSRHVLNTVILPRNIHQSRRPDHDLQSGIAHLAMSTSRGLSLTPNDTALAPVGAMCPNERVTAKRRRLEINWIVKRRDQSEDTADIMCWG